MHARVACQPRTFTGRVVLGCDGAGSTIRELAGITMDDLGFTERWLVLDIRAETGLDTWDGVEQVCDPARAATFMQVTGDRYRWEFRLLDGEDEAGLADFCRQHGLVLVRISSSHAAGTPGRPAADPDAGWIDVRLAGDRRPAGLRALAVLGSNPALTVVVRPDRVVAAVAPRCRLPCLPWTVPATARRGSPVAAHPPAHPDHARPFPSTR